MLITSICMFLVFRQAVQPHQCCARGREKLSVLVGDRFLGNWSESGIPQCIPSIILVTDGIFTFYTCNAFCTSQPFALVWTRL